MTCNHDRLYELTENPALDDPSLDAHLQSCSPCMELYGSIQEFAMALADHGAWAADEPVLLDPRPVGDQLDHLVSESLRLSEERMIADVLVGQLAQEPVAAWHGRLRHLPGACSVGLVHGLLDIGRERAGRAPREFEEIADLAIEVSDALEPAGYPAGVVERVRGLAWKDRANALRVRGQIQDALWSLDEAERHFRQQPVPEFDLATVDYVRATILNETDRLDEGLQLARISAERFLEFGDDQRYRHARMAEGGLLFNAGAKREAREIFMALLKPTQQADDLSALAMLFSNIAHCSVDIEDADTASIYFLQAAHLSDQLGFRSGAIGARWGLGRLLVHSGKFDEGITRLRATASELEQFGADGDAAAAYLDLVEALLITGRHDEVPSICRRLVDRFNASGAQRKALMSLSYLKEAVEQGTASPELARSVRSFLTELPRQPELLFMPPPA